MKSLAYQTTLGKACIHAGLVETSLVNTHDRIKWISREIGCNLCYFFIRVERDANFSSSRENDFKSIHNVVG